MQCGFTVDFTSLTGWIISQVPGSSEMVREDSVILDDLEEDLEFLWDFHLPNPVPVQGRGINILARFRDPFISGANREVTVT